MIDLDKIIRERADAQMAEIGASDWSRERDSWRPARVTPPPKKVFRTRCLAGDCADPVHAKGYCRVHLGRIQRTGMVDEPFEPAGINRRLRKTLGPMVYGRNYPEPK